MTHPVDDKAAAPLLTKELAQWAYENIACFNCEPADREKTKALAKFLCDIADGKLEFYPAGTLASSCQDARADFAGCPLAVPAAAAPEGANELRAIRKAVKAVYYAAHWTPDRECDAATLWTELRDACGFEPGGSPAPSAPVGSQQTEKGPDWDNPMGNWSKP